MKECKAKTITEIIEDVCADICDHYCKYPDECTEKAGGDGDLAYGMLEKICDKCPLTKL